MQTLRTVLVSHWISSRHTLAKGAALAYRHPLETTLFDGLREGPGGTGVFVHWGVYGSGKSTAARHAGLRLQSAGRTVILLHGYNLASISGPGPGVRSLRASLRRSIGVPEDDAQPLSAFFNRPTTLIVDHADFVLRGMGDALETVRELAADSEAGRQSFNALFIVTSWELGLQLRDTGCRVLGSPARWTRAELLELDATLPESDRARWSEAEREEQIDVSVLSGTPDFLHNLLEGGLLGARRAALLDAEWRMGTRAQAEGVCATDAGRFPDRDGVFHWEDVRALR